MRQWWIDSAVNMLTNDFVDGVFVDKANDGGYPLLNREGQVDPSTDKLEMLYELSQQKPEGTFLVGNILRNLRPGGCRELMRFFEGAYLERWHLTDNESVPAQNEADAKSISIQQMREAALKGKILTPSLNGDRMEKDEVRAYLDAGQTNELIAAIQANITIPLAYYLIIAEEYSYFRYQPYKKANFSNFTFPDYVVDPTDIVEELTRPLGAPLGPPVKNGYIYTRSFEHVDVWLNVETEEAILAWDSVDSDADGMSDLWEYRNFGGTTNALPTANPDNDSYTNLE
jgi:hypothetical protein